MWLLTTFIIARPFRWLHPNVITVLGLLTAVVTVSLDVRFGLSNLALAATILCLGMIDSLDGIVATVTNRNSTFGSFLDSMVDRGIDVAIALLLLHHGAPIAGVLAVICLTLIHEYMRARAMGLGMTEVGVITVAEKPTRVAIGVMFFLASAVIPAHSELLLSTAVYVWLALAFAAAGQLFITIKRRLAQP
jgi:CDP-diacylglycerol--glycerol-3-phosphate 3-phosphatidyltransferase